MAEMLDEMEYEALLLLGNLFLKTGKIERALQVYEGMSEKMPDDVQVLKSLAFALIRAGRFGDALPNAERFLRQPGLPDSERVWGTFLKVHALWGLKREPEWKAAIDEFAEIRKRAGLTPLSH